MLCPSASVPPTAGHARRGEHSRHMRWQRPRSRAPTATPTPTPPHPRPGSKQARRRRHERDVFSRGEDSFRGRRRRRWRCGCEALGAPHQRSSTRRACGSSGHQKSRSGGRPMRRRRPNANGNSLSCRRSDARPASSSLQSTRIAVTVSNARSGSPSSSCFLTRRLPSAIGGTRSQPIRLRLQLHAPASRTARSSGGRKATPPTLRKRSSSSRARLTLAAHSSGRHSTSASAVPLHMPWASSGAQRERFSSRRATGVRSPSASCSSNVPTRQTATRRAEQTRRGGTVWTSTTRSTPSPAWRGIAARLGPSTAR